MKDLAELERRITAALARIGAGIDQLQPPPAPEDAPEAATEADTGEETAQLRAELAAAHATADALRSALADAELRLSEAEELTEMALADRAERGEAPPWPVEDTSALLARIEELTQQVDVQGLELQRMRQTSIQLRETLRALREQASTGIEPHLVNRAMLAELEALRATRAAESAELAAILAELAPIVQSEEVQDARD